MGHSFQQQTLFTTAQRIVLSNQVLVSKLWRQAHVHQVPCPLPTEWLQHLQPPSAGGTTSVMHLGDPRAGLAEFKMAFANKVRALHMERKEKQKQISDADGQQDLTSPGPGPSPPPQQVGGQTAAPIPLRNITIPVRRGPLFGVQGIPRPEGLERHEGTGYLQLEPMDLSTVSGLIQAEYRRMMDARLEARIAELEAVVADPNADYGMKYRGSRPPRGAALLELKMLRVLKKQQEVRAAINAEGREVLSMTDKQYRMLLKSHRTTRIETARKDLALRGERAAARAREVKAYRSEVMADANQGSKDLRVARNRAIVRAHERLARDRMKSKDDDRALRMAALKAHDFEAYQEMLRRQAQAGGAGAAAGERFEAISKFLADTEAYLHRLASKIASVKVSAEASNAAARAVADARARGLSEEEVQAAAHAAAAEAASGSEALRSAAEGADAQARYYQLAHSNAEEITDQPRLLRPPNGAQLREYQIVGLQWMVSLYNNHLNGILADEMGLGKTVQVMALIAYLMEKKANYGPHLIIVPNAVIVNWKSELTQWLPSTRCVYYVGAKDERTRKYVTEVQPLQFNVLVTTYEFIMRDRAKLSKIDWQYIIIDEAQRMKDRQSKLARDLDRFTAARRLLLSGTPLQNDLQELWSLLNLLLPDVFDDKKLFAEWFGETISAGGGGDDWLMKEKRVVVIHRLHQILEPFMLRRQVEDVESKLPPKVAYAIKVPMSAHQSAVYTWIKTTGTLRLDPKAPVVGKVRREFAGLQNKCMELRKLCNHPMLSYPPPHWGVGEAIVRQCGKLVVLDRMLVKLKAAGHRVLLFSTMTRLLDLLEVYLQWRELPGSVGGGKMRYLRIDGSTSLEDREIAIQRFNAPDSEAFVFLLSIRAAGRGLNLQTSDTVVIYDPDPNPKNEEQAIARSHRIGQTKEVRVFHLEAVTDAAQPAAAAGNIPEQQQNTTIQPQTRLYGDSIESIVRGQIQKSKIEMANEIIDAGRFDQRTSMEERRQTLEALLQDQDRTRRATNAVPTPEEMNSMLARSEEEKVLFEHLDAEPGAWFDPTRAQEVPPWMRWTEQELRAAIEENSKHKVDVEAEMAALTGTVLHHHHPAVVQPPAVTPHVGPALESELPAGALASPISPETAVEPVATTTTRSMGGEGEEEDEEVAMVDNDEEEEVLDQNLFTDDLTGERTTSAVSDGLTAPGCSPSVRRVDSATNAVSMEGGSRGLEGRLDKRGSDAIVGDDGDDERKALKRPRTLSVHFEGVDDEMGDGKEDGGA